MNTAQRELILKSWSKINEITLIKDVATKGEFIELCQEYIATKKNLTLELSCEYFHKIVDEYVQRLLNEKLTYKAENILHNCKRDIKSIFYQFIFECHQNKNIRDFIIEHLQKSFHKNQNDDDDNQVENFQIEFDNYKFYWLILKDIQIYENLCKIVKHDLKLINLENFMKTNDKYKNIIIIKLYFYTNNDKLLNRLNKKFIWEFFIDEKIYSELIIWCNLHRKYNNKIIISTELLRKYIEWNIDNDMFIYAKENLKLPPNILKDLLIYHGQILPDEKNNINKILNRIFRTECFQKYENILLDKMEIAKYIIDNKLYILLLEDFINVNDLKELCKNGDYDKNFLNLIILLKSNDFMKTEEFIKLSEISREYLQINDSSQFKEYHSFIYFGELLLNNYNLTDIHKSLVSADCKISYISLLQERLQQKHSNNKITPQQLFKIHTNIDLMDISKDFADELPSFSNKLLSEKYSKEFKLNFIHYLKQQRCSSAIYYFFIEQLFAYTQISRSQICSAIEIVNDLAIRNYNNSNLLSHCIGFMEMLNFNTQNLRSLIKLLRNYGKDMKILDLSQLIYLAEEQLFENNYNFINNRKSDERFPLQEYESIWRIAKLNTNIINKPLKYLIILAKENLWWKLLLFIQYFDISLNDIKKIYKNFNIPIMGENFIRALLYDTTNNTPSLTSLSEKSKRRTSFSSRQKAKTKTENTSTTSGDTMTSSISSSNVPIESNSFFKSNQKIKFMLDANELDLFAIIILTTNNIPEERIINFTKFIEIITDLNSYSTSYNLMKNCIKWKLPILTILSTIVCDLNLDWNWLIWLCISTDNYKLIETCGKNSNDIANRLIENCVKNGNIHILHRSFNIFFKDNKFTNFTKFLQESINLNFTDDCITYLRFYFVAWSNNEICLPLSSSSLSANNENNQINKDNIMNFTINLIIQHLKYNFTSAYHKQKLLNLISNSGINDLNPLIDFTLLRNIYEIISTSNDINFDFELFINTKYKSVEIYHNLLTDLNDTKQYDKAIKIAELLNVSTCDIIYTKWINELNITIIDKFDFSIYEYETEKYSLPPEFLVNFYLYTSQQYNENNYQKYLMYKAALDVIKNNHLFPNETFDRDLIEYEMIICLIKCDQKIDNNIDIYHSEYFEEILMNERFVLYKSFLELKELAGIDDLTTKLKIELNEIMKSKLSDLLNLLLDKGDIVEALRLQAMFECPTVDLRYLVFCMALAEGLTTIYNLSDEERMIFVNVEKSLFVKKFEKRTLDTTTTVRPNTSERYGGAAGGGEMSDSNSTIEFEEIPSKEKQEILDALQGFASNLKYGVNLGKRIVMTYRTAMYLDKDYVDVLRTKDAIELLKNAIEWDCLKKLLVVNDIFTSTQMTSAEISEFLAHEIATAIIRPVFYILNVDQQNINYHQIKKSILWGYDLDREFHLILELCPNTTILGQHLFSYCDVLKVYRKYQENQKYEHTKTFEKLNEIIKKYGLPNTNPCNSSTKQVLSHKKQNTIYVELLIKAHECFMHECSMEGIADVLNRAKNLNNILAKANSWKLITRMLTGIGRYREMFYCFDTLIQNDQFEFLLGQFDEVRTKGLRYAIISYIRDTCPQNKEYLKLVALHFLMYKELAEMWEEDANLNILKIISSNQIMENNNTSTSVNLKYLPDISKKPLVTKLKCTSDVLVNLKQVLESLSQSTENYLLDNKLRLAQQAASKAELIAMQIDLVNKGLANGICNVNCCVINYCICVINIQSRDEFREIINSELRVPQALILSRAYSYDINWSEVLLWQFVILDNRTYLDEFIKLINLSDPIIENIIKGFQLHTQVFACTAKMEENLEILVEMIKSVSLRYKLASVLSLKRTITTMLNDESLYYLKDSNYGRNDFNIPDS